jgi:(E)-4-hydroxy-3-methyl-but-2-enyl pyrophosphate reductase
MENAYALHSLVHSEIVAERLKAQGIEIVEDVADIPEGESVIISAHGAGLGTIAKAKSRNLKIVDATCPSVAKVHADLERFAGSGCAVAIIGHKEHIEVKGYLDTLRSAGMEENMIFAIPDVATAAAVEVVGRKLAVVSQTSFNSADVEKIVEILGRRNSLEVAAKVCAATAERQEAVRRFGGDAVLVLGSKSSSNTRRLCEVAPVKSMLASSLDEVRALDLKGIDRLGVTSGASTPESFFKQALSLLAKRIAVMLALAFAALNLPAADEIQEIGGVKYICRDGMCLPLEEAQAQNAATNAPAAATAEAAAEKISPRKAEGYMDEEAFAKFLANEKEESAIPYDAGIALLVLLALAGGLAMNLTPCILPMVPVNLMIIGPSAARGLWYALGMTLAYGTLGVAAAFGFSAFGAIQSSAWFNLAVAAVFAALSLALSGIWTLDLTRRRSAITSKVADRRGIVFLVTMGAVSAVLAGACVAPVLVAFLVLTADLFAEGKKAALLLPFALAFGMALPWPFAAAGMKLLPRPGAWMKWVNRIFAAVVMVMALWYLHLALIGFGILGAVDKPGSVEVSGLEAALENSPRPVLVDCWASWCKNCSAMEKVLASEKVKAELKRGNYSVIKVRSEDLGELRSIRGFETVKGLPAFVIFE